MGLFSRLGYDSANTASQDLSADAVKTMSSMPPILNTWQAEDAGNNDVGSYFQNPVLTVTQDIISVANSIVAITGISEIANLSSIYSSAGSVYTPASNFIAHTNRISGMVAQTPSTATLPHYNTAMGLGKVVMQIVFQTDGVQNNAPIMGNFTSVTCGDTLDAFHNTIITYPDTIQHSINAVSVTVTDPETGGESTITTYTSNLTPIEVSTISNQLTSIKNYFDARRTADVAFYNNCQSIVNDYNALKQFSNPGQSELDLMNNYIGSDKLKTRLNS